ncbi:MAG: hypothetical protein HQL91_05205 [Magnetococcales bacterium]|nr:hypothetical protein [Magnetococcales bacterium]
MAENVAAPGSSVIDVPLWWRKITNVEFAAVRRARRTNRPALSVHPGLGGETRSLLESEQEHYASGRVASLAQRWRHLVLEIFNAKLNRVVERSRPGADLLVPHPMQWHESGSGLTFWVPEGEFAAGDLLELRFALFAEQPMPMHAYCRVQRVRPEWNGTGIRVDCVFETVEDPQPLPQTASAPEVVRPASLPASPPASLPVQAHAPAVAESAQERWDHTLAAGKAMLEVDPRVVAAHVTPPPPPPPRPVPRAAPPPATVSFQGGVHTGTKRQDFRLNDNLPLAWKVLTQKSFDQAIEYFENHREFPLRERVARQKRLLAEVDVQLKLLKQLNVKARRPVVWFREFLDQRFRQANSENEEEFYQSALMLFFALIRELTKRPPGSMTAAQVVSLIKDQVDLQMARDLMDPVSQKQARSKAEEDLVEVRRQSSKLMAELRAAGSDLAGKLEGLREAFAMMDLSLQDIPKQLTAEGDAIFTVNLSATGVAWSTLKSRIYKGDLVEVRLGVDPEGRGMEVVWAYGRVVVVAEPDEQGKRRVASYFEHMAPLHREKLQAHIVRRQREELVRRANSNTL